MLEGHHYQNAYITRNMNKALEAFRTRGGVANPQSFDASVEVTTPKGRGLASTKLAFIWIGDMQYELIEPVSGMVDLYTDALPKGDELVFHHIAMRVDDWDVFRAKVEQQKYPVVLEGGNELLRFLYLDARPFLGHYLEYVWATPERWKQMGGS